MSDIPKDLHDLSPKKRALFELLLREKRERAARAERIPRRPAADTCPLSFAQQRLWFLDQLQPGSSAYTLPVAVNMAGALDLPALARSLNEIVRRHERSEERRV